MTPDEIIRSAYGELHDSLSSELLSKILAAPPDFFERLVVQLLIAMGYGGSAIEAGKALGKSGDGGVDGVIDQDALGLDRIYVQAKRYTDSKVSISKSVVSLSELLRGRIDFMEFIANPDARNVIKGEIYVYRKFDKVQRCFRVTAHKRGIEFEISGSSTKATYGPPI